MATNAPNYGGARGRRSSGGQLPAGARVGVTPGVNGGGVPPQVRANLGAVTRGNRVTTNSQPS